jgi:hypothetical protein
MPSSAPRIRPAFASRGSALLFCALLGALLLFPVALHRLFHWRFPRAGLDSRFGNFSYMDAMSAPGAPPIDILLLGDSTMRTGVDPHMLEAALAARFHRPFRVVSFSYNHRSEELNYRQLRNLLASQTPKLVIVDMFTIDRDTVHVWSYRILNMDEGPDFYAGLSPWQRFQFYIQNVLGVPHALVNQLREPARKDYPADFRGSEGEDLGWRHAPFVRLDLHPPRVFPPEEAVYSSANKDRWEFQEHPFMPLQQRFFEKLTQLAARTKVPLAVLDIPLAQHRDAKVQQRLYWPRYFSSSPFWMVGIPSAQLFQGLSDDQARNLYYDDVHMSSNGRRYFTEAITPAIVHVFAEAQHAKE